MQICTQFSYQLGDAWEQLIKIKAYIQALVPELINSTDSDSKKDGKNLEHIMLTSDEWELLQELIIILGPFEEATRYLGEEKYITYSIMVPIIEQIKNLLLSSNSPPNSSTIITSPAFNTPEIFQEIENADDIFVVITSRNKNFRSCDNSAKFCTTQHKFRLNFDCHQHSTKF